MNWAAFVSELMDRTDEIEGACLTANGKEVWIHTTKQVDNWLMNAVTEFKKGEYLTD